MDLRFRHPKIEQKGFGLASEIVKDEIWDSTGWGFTSNFPRVKINKERQCEEKNMSFVGIINNKDGVFAFADNRNTSDGTADFERPNVKKIYSNDNMILVACGTGKIVDINDDTTPLDVILKDYIEDKKYNLEDFIKHFITYLSEKLCSSYFHFIAFNKDTYKFDSFVIEDMTYKFIERNENDFCDGAAWFKSLFETYTHKNNIFILTNDDFETMITEQIIPVIRTVDKSIFYSPVSPSFDVIEYNLSGNEIVKRFE